MMRLASNETKHKSNKGLVPLVTLSVRKGSSVAYGICDDIGRSGTKPGGGSNPYSNPRGCYSNPQGSYLNPRRRALACGHTLTVRAMRVLRSADAMNEYQALAATAAQSRRNADATSRSTSRPLDHQTTRSADQPTAALAAAASVAALAAATSEHASAPAAAAIAAAAATSVAPPSPASRRRHLHRATATSIAPPPGPEQPKPCSLAAGRQPTDAWTALAAGHARRRRKAAT